MFATIGPEPTPAPFRSVPLTIPRTASSPSIPSIPFRAGEDDDIVTVEGLRHARNRLEARQYKSKTFARKLLETIYTLRIPSWFNAQIVSDGIKVQKVSGSLTNAVFFVSYPSNLYVRTLLLRIYGASSGNLISRPRELQTLYTLSSKYHIGPRVYGTFENGRFEEHFNAVALTASDLRNKEISHWIGTRMAELHQVDIDEIEGFSANHEDGAKKNVRSWISPAKGVLALPAVRQSVRASLDLDAFVVQWEKYMQWLKEVERKDGASRQVFSHNDAQYGNILRLAKQDSTLEHRQIIVVDFEYASPNPAAFDIANHFQEWTANYHSSIPHILDPSRYPTLEQRRNFYSAYISHSYRTLPDSEKEKMMTTLDSQVRAWSPASQAMWGLWGIVQAREALEANESEPEFDYIGYAQCRLDGFRSEIRALGVPL